MLLSLLNQTTRCWSSANPEIKRPWQHWLTKWKNVFYYTNTFWHREQGPVPRSQVLSHVNNNANMHLCLHKRHTLSYLQLTLLSSVLLSLAPPSLGFYKWPNCHSLKSYFTFFRKAVNNNTVSYESTLHIQCVLSHFLNNGLETFYTCCHHYEICK